MTTINWKKYFIVFVITSAIFFTAVFLNNFLNNKKIKEIKAVEEKISMDILASETQYALLEQASCKFLDSSALSPELNNLAQKLSYMERQFSQDSEDLIDIKKYYSLLQIKDYLLMQKMNEKCDTKPVSILYFYSNKGDCSDCEKAGYVLTYLRQKYPLLRVYSFDYNLDLPTIKTLVSINKIESKFPAIVIGEKTYYGFKEKDEMEKLIPGLEKLKMISEEEENNI